MIYRKITYPGVRPDVYLIGPDGEVFSLLTYKILKPYEDKDGYFRIGLSGTNIFVHRLVAWEFHPETRNMSLVVDHKDGNKQNNWDWNLEWVTVKENTNRAERMGLRNVRGSANGNNNYSEELIHEICSMFQAGKSNMDIFRLFKNKDNTSNMTKEEWSFYQLIYKLRHRIIWSDITSQYKYEEKSSSMKIYKPNLNSRFSEEQVHQICQEYLKGKTPYEILEGFGIYKENPSFNKNADAIHSILAGKTWRYITDSYNIKENKHPVSNKYNISYQLICDLIDAGASDEYILNLYGLKCRKDHPSKYTIIKQKINKYRFIKTKKANDEIEIKPEEIE